MASLDRPRLRPLSFRRIEHGGEDFVSVEDPLGVVPAPVLVPWTGFQRVFRHFDGAATLIEIQARIFRETARRVPMDELEFLVEHLDRAMVLDGPTFAAFLDAYRRECVRPAALAGGSYASNGRALRAQLAGFFAHSEGAGTPRDEREPTGVTLRGIMSPHIDFTRGGPVYTWAYRRLVEDSDADTFVILGVAHQYCRNRFALTRKDFETPLGLVRTDRDYVDRIAALAGGDLFDDELAHRSEHSIEFQVIFLQYLLAGRRDFSIVPILAGSFHDLMEAGIDPIQDDDVRRFVEALHEAERASGRRVAYIGGIDLCHVGPEFGDRERVDPPMLERIRAFDTTLLGRAEANDPAGWFGTVADVGNRWRVCGLAAAYTMLHAIGPARGRVLKYDQAVDVHRTCCVSFASLAFESDRESTGGRT